MAGAAPSCELFLYAAAVHRVCVLPDPIHSSAVSNAKSKIPWAILCRILART